MALKEMGGDGLSGAFRLPAGFSREQEARENGDDDGDGSSATENMGGSSDDDLDADYDPAYATAPKCINCTAPLFMDAVCSVRELAAHLTANYLRLLSVARDFSDLN